MRNVIFFRHLLSIVPTTCTMVAHAHERGGRCAQPRLILSVPLLVLIFGWGLSANSATAALTTTSPEVKAAVDRATTYLETASDERFGGQALIGITLHKTGREADHPNIQKAVAAIRNHISKGPHNQNDVIYSLALSLILLAELDSEGYKTEIDWLLKRILSIQKSNGAWGYLDQSVGDTSQTQYAVLALWTATEAGYEVPDQVWNNVMNWLVRTQDISGAFGYHPDDPGNYVRMYQTGTTNSLTAAGLGSLYICQDHLRGASEQVTDTSVPSALHAKLEDGKQRRTGTDNKRLVKALKDGDRWTQQDFTVKPSDYGYYYMYAFERHQSFKQAVGSRNTPVDNWYDQIARQLLKTQSTDGTWSERCGTPCDTAFAVLFLIRSTRLSLMKAGKFGAGTLVGGRGLPSGDGQLDLHLGRVTTRPRKGPADELLGMMDNPNHPSYLAAVQGFEALAEEADIELLDKHAARLQRLAHGGDAEARVAAVKALARTRDLDNVPTLIYALSDPDARVATAADDGLKAISRRTRGFGPLGESGSEERAALIDKWKQWFLVIRPDAEFDD